MPTLARIFSGLAHFLFIGLSIISISRKFVVEIRKKNVLFLWDITPISKIYDIEQKYSDKGGSMKQMHIEKYLD